MQNQYSYVFKPFPFTVIDHILTTLQLLKMPLFPWLTLLSHSIIGVIYTLTYNLKTLNFPIASYWYLYCT